MGFAAGDLAGYQSVHGPWVLWVRDQEGRWVADDHAERGGTASDADVSEMLEAGAREGREDIAYWPAPR